jgi:hypothetical protein
MFMAFIFIGHGLLDPSGTAYQPGMDVVAVPPETRLQFYTDAGQGLRYGDLESVWAQLQAPWPPLTSRHVTYNLTLQAAEQSIIDLWLAVEEKARTGHRLRIVGHHIDCQAQLCTGNKGECPTDPREGRQHRCRGILTQYAGEELHWIACTGVMLPETEQDRAEYRMDERRVNEIRAILTAARTDAFGHTSPPSAFLNTNPDSLDVFREKALAEVQELFKYYHQDADHCRKFIEGEFSREELELLGDDIREMFRRLFGEELS